MKSPYFIETYDVLGKRGIKVSLDRGAWRDASCELSEYFKKDTRVISSEFWRDKETFDKIEQGVIEKDPSKQQIESYYKNTKRYLYECTCWECYISKQRDFKKIFLLLKKIGFKKILDFGGGTGGLTIYLSKRGIGCDYIDIAGETYSFAKWRFRRNDLTVSLYDDIRDCRLGYYDAVISDNVFEHLFNLEETVREISAVLRPGGLLITRSSFGGGGAHLRKNDIYSQFERYDQMLSSSGFEYCGQLKDDFLTREINKWVQNPWVLGISLKKRRKSGGNFLVHLKNRK